MSFSGKTIKIKSLWTRYSDKAFNTLTLGNIQSAYWDSAPSIILGCEDGIIRVHPFPGTLDVLFPNKEKTEAEKLNVQTCLETKGGPIQVAAIHNVTKFISNDLILGDSRGMLTVFSNGQILSRQMVSDNSIRCLQVEEDATGQISIVTCDSVGLITASLPYNTLWKLKLSDFPPIKGVPLCTKSLLCVTLPNAANQKSNYILVSDDQCHLFVIQQGNIVMMLDTPGVVTAMCVGKFLLNLEPVGPPFSNSDLFLGSQVALGTESGAVYLFSNFEIYQDEYGNAELPITNLTTLSATDKQEVDSLLCAGHFNALCIFNNGKVLVTQQDLQLGHDSLKEIVRHHTSDWVSAVVTTESDKHDRPALDGNPQIIYGCKDNSIHSIQIDYT